jgi:hypothetical protein
MPREDFIKALWEAASELGLTSRWQFWVAVVALLLLLAWHKVAPTPPATDGEGLPVDGKAPPMDMPEGGMPLDQKPDPDQATKG